MGRILLVESCPKEAATIKALLESAGFEVSHVSSAETAFGKIESGQIDLVLTALFLPQMDGLELVAQCRRRHPTLPVVVATAHGSEEVAVKALRAGAANYIPKEIIRRELVTALDEVLAAAAFQRNCECLQECLKSMSSHFELKSDPMLIEFMCEQIHASLRELLTCEEIELIRTGVALREALSNALQHGNLEVDSALRQRDDKPYFDLVQRRLREARYCERRIFVDVTVSRSEAVFVVRDEGSGFDPSRVMFPTEMPDSEQPCGRGLFLIRNFMDEVRHNEKGNEITMIKRYAEPPHDAATNGDDFRRNYRSQTIRL